MGLGINDHIKSLQGCLFLRSVDKTRSSYWPQGCQCILRAEVAKGAVFCFGVSDWKGCVMSRPACPVHLMCEESQILLLLLQEKCAKNSREPTGDRKPHLYPFRSYSRGSLDGTLSTSVKGAHRLIRKWQPGGPWRKRVAGWLSEQASE